MKNLENALMTIIQSEIVLFKSGDVSIDGGVARDSRTLYDINTRLYIVKPISYDAQGYFTYCCPDCGELHQLHKQANRTDIPTGCTNHQNRRRFRIFPLVDGSVLKVPFNRMTLDTSDWKKGGGSDA